MIKSTEQGNVIRDYFIGNTRIKICDDCCRGRTSEEADAILGRIAWWALEQFSTPAIDAPCIKSISEAGI